MEVIEMSLNAIKAFDRPLCACIGYFDGIHIAHQELMLQAKQCAQKNGAYSAVISFDPDPWCVLKDIRDIAHITTKEERIAFVEKLGIDKYIFLSFTKELSALSPREFEQSILCGMNVSTLVCGFDFHYGHYGKGNIETLRNQQDFKIEVVSEVDFENEKISSTRIEKAIENGHMALVESMLGRPYSMSGEVIDGDKIGRKLGFPTANLKLNDLYVLPLQGVYYGLSEVDGIQHPSIINVGYNPTLNQQDSIRIEAHLLDFEGDLYHKTMRVSFIERLREEKRFSSKDELIEQLRKDEENARNYKLRR